MTRGQLTEVSVTNSLTEATSVHWHGLMTTSNVDITGNHLPPGQTVTVRFTPNQPAATLWINPHEQMRTGEQIFRGLASVVLLDDGGDTSSLPHTYGVDDTPAGPRASGLPRRTTQKVRDQERGEAGAHGRRDYILEKLEGSSLPESRGRILGPSRG